MDGGRISRRDFLKILGMGVAGVGLGAVFKFSGISDLVGEPTRRALAQSSGSWAAGPNTSSVAIHSALLPNGKIFYLAGSGYHEDRPNGPFDARIFDPNTSSETNLSLSEDLFCGGSTVLPNGNILFVGGTLMYDTNPDNCNGIMHGLRSAYVLDWNSGSLNQVSPMAHGRWYPTLVTLADGTVFTVTGLDEYGVINGLLEIYDPNSNSWSIRYDPSSSNTYCVGAGQACAGAGSPCYGGPNNGVTPLSSTYPRMHLMPSGLVVLCGGGRVFMTWNPSTGVWGPPTTQNRPTRAYGTSFLLPLSNSIYERGKILLCGGSTTSNNPGLTSVDILDFDLGSSTNPVVRQVASLAYGRRYLAPVILPNGKLVVFGGTAQGNNTEPVYVPEIFDPVTETWQSLPPASVPRYYHQTSILLPDGRVWTAGGTPHRNIEENRTEIFSPDYLFMGPRPTIESITSMGNYGGVIEISTPEAAAISSVSLVRLMATTHHYDANQRLIWLQIVEVNSNGITVAAPINANIAPPGHYMLFILTGSGIPSVASIIKVPGTGPGGDTSPPAQVSSLIVTPFSDSRLDLSWNANAELDLHHYDVYRDTTTGFNVTLGSTPPLAQPTTNSFSDTNLAPTSTFYYRVAAVDGSGNIGTLSEEATGTTSSVNPIIYNVPIPGDGSAGLQAGSSIRYGEEANTVSSLLVGKALKIWKVRLRKRINTSPSGNVTAKIRRRSDDTIVATFNETINSRTLDTSFAEYAFTLATPYTIQVGDRIMIEYNGPASIELELWNSDKFDGANTRRVRYTTSYSFSNTVDVTGSMSIAVDTTAPVQVNGLTVTTLSDTKLNLVWDQNTEQDLARYNIYRGTDSGFSVTPGITQPIATPASNSYQDTELTPSTTYYYKVAAVDSSGNIGTLSVESSASTEAPDTTPPGEVIGLAIAPFSDEELRGLNLDWTANTEPDLDHYNVYRDTTSGFSVTPGTTPPYVQSSSNSFADTGLAGSTTYYYRIAAVDIAGNIGFLSQEGSGTTFAANPVFYSVPIPGDGSAGLQAGSSIRYGEEANATNSLLVGRSLKAWKVRMRKRKSPSGGITAKVRRRSDDAVVATFTEIIDSATLGTVFGEYTFTLDAPYTIQVGDRIMIEYSGPASIELELWNSDKFDGSKTRRVRYTNSYSFSNTVDVTGNMSSE